MQEQITNIENKQHEELFIQKTNRNWVHSQLENLVQSDVHLSKFIVILTDFIIKDSHPVSTRHALIWLEYCLRNYSSHFQLPQIRKSLRLLCSHINQLSQMDSLFLQASTRGLVMENWGKSSPKINFIPHKYFYDNVIDIPSSNYSYTDGPKQHTKPKSATHSDDDRTDSESNLSVQEDEDFDYHSIESDAGVFDVNNELISSEPDQSTTDVGPEPSNVSLFNFDDTSDSDQEDTNQFDWFQKENCVIDDLSIASENSNDSHDDDDDDDDVDEQFSTNSDESDENEEIEQLVESIGNKSDAKQNIENEDKIQAAFETNTPRSGKRKSISIPNQSQEMQKTPRQSKRLRTINQSLVQSEKKNSFGKNKRKST